MVRSRLFSMSLLVLATLFLLQAYDDMGFWRVAFVHESSATADRSLLSYFPLYELTQLGHTGYPVPMMFGFICRGNVELRRACGGKPYPNWLMGFLLGFICYTYPANIMSDTLFAPGVLRGMSNNNIIKCHIFWYLLVQNCDAVYKFLTGTHVNIWLTVLFIWDASHASLCFLERAVSPPLGTPVFSRALFQCFVWCSAGAILGSAEKAIRGVAIPKLDATIPNSLNPLGHPVICMFWGMVTYLLYLTYATDCGVFQEGGKTLFECGIEHPDIYSMCHFVPMALHVLRAYHALGSKPLPAAKSKVDEEHIDSIKNQELIAGNRSPGTDKALGA